METVVDTLTVGFSFLLYTLGFGFQIKQNFQDPANTEAIHPLIYWLGAGSLVTLTLHASIHGNWILFLSIVPGDSLGAIILFQFFHYKLGRKSREVQPLGLEET